MHKYSAMFFILLLGLLLLIMGMQGSMGRVVAVIFTPASLDVAA